MYDTTNNPITKTQTVCCTLLYTTVVVVVIISAVFSECRHTHYSPVQPTAATVGFSLTVTHYSNPRCRAQTVIHITASINRSAVVVQSCEGRLQVQLVG